MLGASQVIECEQSNGDMVGFGNHATMFGLVFRLTVTRFGLVSARRE
jgi:hypothetical protein